VAACLSGKTAIGELKAGGLPRPFPVHLESSTQSAPRPEQTALPPDPKASSTFSPLTTNRHRWEPQCF